jgi:hypothetical protein
MDDVTKGHKFKDSAFQRVPETLSKVVFGENNQSDVGSDQSKTSRRVKRRKRDIFS